MNKEHQNALAAIADTIDTIEHSDDISFTEQQMLHEVRLIIETIVSRNEK